jgi:type VI secretion system protein ImpE
MSGTDETIGALFKAGQLDEAVAAANQAVRRAPGDPAARVLLAELLLFIGNFERADAVLDAAAAVDTTVAMAVAEFRQLLRAEMARRQLWRDGRVPEFLGEPGEMEKSLLAAMVALRVGDAVTAAAHADEAEAARTASPVTIDDADHADFRDADDLCGGVMEVLTTTGKYFWIPIARIATIDFHAPQRPRDLAWRRASMSVVGGPDGDVYVPAIYVGSDGESSMMLRLGRETAWSETAPVRGSGQRVFLAGEEGPGIMEMTTLRFAAHA